MSFFKEYEVKFSRPNTPYGFRPRRLIVEGKPSLSVFSFNVMFMSYGEKDNKNICGTALYDPDLSSITEFKREKTIVIKYYNRYCLKHDTRRKRHCSLIILYNKKRKQYFGTKYLWEINTCKAEGKNWDEFFANFTSHGLYNNECCEFEELTIK